MKCKHMLVTSLLRSIQKRNESFNDVKIRAIDDNIILLRIYNQSKNDFSSIKDLKNYIRKL